MNKKTLGTGRGFSASEKNLAGVFGALLVGAVLWPVVENWREQPRDNFPLSYYPMFSLKRAEATTVRYLVGIDARGERHLLPHACAGTGGLNQVRRQINKLVRAGEAETLCKLVAADVAKKRGKPFADVVTVQVVVGRYKLADFFADGKGSVWGRMEASRVKETVEASRPVERGRKKLRFAENPA